jgi:hypothetical protein
VSISNRKAEVDEMLHDAEVTNAREDKAFGKDRRGDELPKHLQTKERRLAAMRKAKADLEERARTDAAEKAGNKVDEQGLGDDEKATLVDAAAAVAVPKAPRRYRLLQRGQRRRDDHLTSASCSGRWCGGGDMILRMRISRPRTRCRPLLEAPQRRDRCRSPGTIQLVTVTDSRSSRRIARCRAGRATRRPRES